MKKNIFENKLILFAILALATTAFFYLATLDWGDRDPNGEFSEQTGSQENDYKTIQQRILNYQANKKWNVARYNQLSNQISENKEKNKLKNEDIESLNQLLESTHLLLLSDSIVNFCIYVKGLKSIDPLKKDLAKFNSPKNAAATAILKEYIGNYERFCYIYWGINSYVKESLYIQTAFFRKEREIKEYETKDLFYQNPDIQDKIKFGLDRLQKHKLAGIIYSDTYFPECNCEQVFKGFDTYIDSCNAVKIRQKAKLEEQKANQ